MRTIKPILIRFGRMKINKLCVTLLTVFFFLISDTRVQACSMYKITVDGKTMVGCNEDAWRTTSKIWFENGRSSNEYGAGFTGSREVGSDKTAPQSGMNEMGLAFSRLVAYFPNQKNPFTDRAKITNEVKYLTDILHKCATVENVKKHIEQFDHSLFFDHVFIYIDSTGKYLIVEPYNLILGDEPNYLLSNFCPSITDDESARKLNRYRNGEDFLNTHEVNSSLSFCSALSDTMHVCRSRNGDGTLLTSIWDLKDKLVNLYFYHSYDTTLQFNLSEELAKGDHIIDLPDLFPKNKEFERLKTYITPFNTPKLRYSLVLIGGVLTFLSFLLGIYVIKNKKSKISLKPLILLSAMNLLLTAYLVVLFFNKYIYFFDAPYKHHSSNLISASSYIPFLLLLIIVPFSSFIFKQNKSFKMKTWVKALLFSNNLIYILLIISFSYWGLYSIWN